MERLNIIKNIVLFLLTLSVVFLLNVSFALNNKIISSYPTNSPYTESLVSKNILFSNFSEQPKHLDPARAYSSNEYVFIAQIYEPLYEYHYLLRPYQLTPLSAEGMITEEYYNKDNFKLSITASNQEIAYTIYTIKIKPGIFYQPHPAFVKNKSNNTYTYHQLDSRFIKSLDSIRDFDYKIGDNNFINTRELVANDFIYQIKRLADPKVQSPIYSLMATYIVGLDNLNQQLDIDNKKNKKKYLKLNSYNLEGVKLLNKYTYQMKIKGKYPQFKYWLAMPFFSPIPWEADKFYSQAGLSKQNISLDTAPVGTGPYMLTENNPNRRMVLNKNPNYKHGFYPNAGMPQDDKSGFLMNSNRKLPLVETIIFYLEKEFIPIWNKFLQGYYDYTAISSDNFEQAIEVSNSKTGLTQEMKDRDIRLIKSIEPSIFYWGFNMLDPVVGGYSDKQRKLRQAIGIVFDIEEYIDIFRNGRGTIAHSPIPPVIMPVKEQKEFNNYLYNDYKTKKSLDVAKKLLEEAGYPGGINPETEAPLRLNFDAVTSGNSSDNARFRWLREQFEKLNIKLNIRATQYNRYQDKMRSGKAQIFSWGWNADYPDAENFLFLFLCEQGKVKHKGENASNYCNNDYEILFKALQDENNKEKQRELINKMVALLQFDSPWLFGYYNESYVLQHGWNSVNKPFTVGNNNLKYRNIDVDKRVLMQKRWNQPLWWPVILVLLLLASILIPVFISYYKKIHYPKFKFKKVD